MDFEKEKLSSDERTRSKSVSHLDENCSEFFKMDDDVDMHKRRTTTIKEEESRRPSIVYEEDMPVIVRRRGVTMTVR